MCLDAPAIIYLLDRMGVPFSRTAEGRLDFRRFGGTLYHRTAFAGATTGQQLLYALDEQVRRAEAEGLVRSTSAGSSSAIVKDDAGSVPRDRRDGPAHDEDRQAFPADAVLLATGGPRSGLRAHPRTR